MSVKTDEPGTLTILTYFVVLALLVGGAIAFSRLNDRLSEIERRLPTTTTTQAHR